LTGGIGACGGRIRRRRGQIWLSCLFSLPEQRGSVARRGGHGGAAQEPSTDGGLAVFFHGDG